MIQKILKRTDKASGTPTASAARHKRTAKRLDETNRLVDRLMPSRCWLMMSAGVTALAAGDPMTVISNLSDFIFGLIRAIGLILLGFDIVQIGLSLKWHDPSQKANGFLTLAGGIIITFAKEILTLITG